MPDRYQNSDEDHVVIVKPDLAKQKYLQSKHSTPV